VHINGKTITIGGDVISGNKYTQLRDASAIDTALKPVESAIQIRLAPDLKVEALQRVYTIGEWAKQCDPNMVEIGTALKWLMSTTPELTGPLKIALASPAFSRSIKELALVVLPEDVVVH
jgi:hypothetical protein